MRRALLFVPLILACGGLGTKETGDAGSFSEDPPPPPRPASLAVDRPVVNLGTLGVGATGEGSVVITNLGGEASGPVIVTPSPGISTTGCEGVLEAGASCTLVISAVQTYPHSITGTVEVSATPGADTTLVISVLTNTLCGPLFSVTPTTYDLGPIPLGFPVPPIEFTVTSKCVDLTDLVVAASGPDVAVNAEATTCTSVLAISERCVVVVDLLAATVGNATDAVTISVGGPAGKTVALPISANVVTGSYLVIDPSSLQNLAAFAGQASSPFAFTVGNQGDTSTGALSVGVTGPNAAEFLVASTCSVLAPLEKCTVTVVYQPAPTSVGSGVATLTVFDTASIDATLLFVDVPLTGTVVPRP